ncbi:DUF2852 domain-containing protein [Rhizobium sp. L1K21]|uniref:DUF2852 domain-containing protein n=1 Tax=Rhizobium sp. L1K21 TaxID=2954933 RepID=UPI002091F910|nr:DUF2852 domain-containing protein [Rhizobium sp. L1K21]MCO6188147.1 DUF2852 domain-containing protein [Rhizobium sp. L1K21]
MHIASRLDEGGRAAWIATMIVGFIIFWPLGLAILAYTIWSGRMSCRYGHASEMKNEWRAYKEEWRARKREMRNMWRSERSRYHAATAPSGNSAFDDYKAETLRRLEEEQEQFNEFLDNLRKARDKAEFDQFMASRRNVVDPNTTQDNNDGNHNGGSVPSV